MKVERYIEDGAPMDYAGTSAMSPFRAAGIEPVQWSPGWPRTPRIRALGEPRVPERLRSTSALR